MWRRSSADSDSLYLYEKYMALAYDLIVQHKVLGCCNYNIVYKTRSALLWHGQGNYTLQWCHNGRDGVSNHQPHHCLLNRLFRRRSKKTSKLRVTGLCAGNSPVTGELPAQMASNAENVSIWWRHHQLCMIRKSAKRYKFPTTFFEKTDVGKYDKVLIPT